MHPPKITSDKSGRVVFHVAGDLVIAYPKEAWGAKGAAWNHLVEHPPPILARTPGVSSTDNPYHACHDDEAYWAWAVRDITRVLYTRFGCGGLIDGLRNSLRLDDLRKVAAAIEAAVNNVTQQLKDLELAPPTTNAATPQTTEAAAASATSSDGNSKEENPNGDSVDARNASDGG